MLSQCNTHSLQQSQKLMKSFPSIPFTILVLNMLRHFLCSPRIQRTHMKSLVRIIYLLYGWYIIRYYYNRYTYTILCIVSYIRIIRILITILSHRTLTGTRSGTGSRTGNITGIGVGSSIRRTRFLRPSFAMSTLQFIYVNLKSLFQLGTQCRALVTHSIRSLPKFSKPSPRIH